jgi:hypothetical protein
MVRRRAGPGRWFARGRDGRPRCYPGRPWSRRFVPLARPLPVMTGAASLVSPVRGVAPGQGEHCRPPNTVALSVCGSSDDSDPERSDEYAPELKESKAHVSALGFLVPSQLPCGTGRRPGCPFQPWSFADPPITLVGYGCRSNREAPARTHWCGRRPGQQV